MPATKKKARTRRAVTRPTRTIVRTTEEILLEHHLPGKTDVFRCTLTGSLRGGKLLHLRRWYRAVPDGELMPGKGLALPFTDDSIDVLEEAVAVLRRNLSARSTR